MDLYRFTTIDSLTRFRTDVLLTGHNNLKHLSRQSYAILIGFSVEGRASSSSILDTGIALARPVSKVQALHMMKLHGRLKDLESNSGAPSGALSHLA